MSLSQNYFAPGHTYNVVLTNPPGYFGSNGGPLAGQPQNFYVVTAASYAAGLLYDEDPYVTVSNEVLVSPTTITVTIAVAANAPTENDAWALWCYGAVYQGPGSVSITPCAAAVAPTISSIQPTAFFAGSSTPITITGTGFVPTNNTNSCAPTTPSITAGSENVALSNVNVVSPTEITLTAAPQASDPLEAASITVANYSLNGPPYYLNSNAEPAEILPIPTILWNNNTISGAKAQSAVVGQPINLTTTPTATTLSALSVPLTISKSTWVVGGTNIAGYSPSTGPTVAPSPTVLINATLNAYWVYGGEGVTVMYNYCVNVPNQLCSSNATATFNVSGQGTAKMSVTDYGSATIENLYAPPSCKPGTTTPPELPGQVQCRAKSFRGADESTRHRSWRRPHFPIWPAVRPARWPQRRTKF